MFRWLLVGWFVLLSGLVQAVTVPGDYATIQEALDDLMDGKLEDGVVIELQEGTYRESLLYADSDKGFTLTGVAGRDKTIIDAQGTDEPGIWIRNTSAHIVLRGISVRNARSEDAGGVLFHDASPTLEDCIIESNSSADNGAGVRLYTSNAVIRNCIIRDNRSDRAGGGIIMVENSRPTLSDIQVLNNRAGMNHPYGTGGGIQINNSSPVIRNALISGNQAYFAGGGLFIIGEYDRPEGRQNVVITDTEITDNRVDSWDASYPLAEGGGLHVEDNVLASLDNVVVSDNTAQSGGGLNSFRARLEVRNSRIENNISSDGMGGGIHVNSQRPYAGQLLVEGSRIANNRSVNGGGILIQGDGCRAGGVCAWLELEGVTIEGNVSNENGGGVSLAYADAVIRGSTIARNSVNRDAGHANGGGIRIVSSDIVISDTIVDANSAAEYGGGIYVSSHSQSTLVGVRITNNRSGENNAQGSGGGIQVVNSALSMRSCTVSGNHAYASGGGLSVLAEYDKSDDGFVVDIRHSTITDNLVERWSSAYSLAEGGGIYAGGDALVKLTSVEVSNNVADSGGGLSSYRARYELDDSVVKGNLALAGSGGGIFVNSKEPYAASLSLKSSLVAENQAHYGGGILAQGTGCGTGGLCAQLDVESSVLDSNEAVANGGALALADVQARLTGSRITRNRLTDADAEGNGAGMRAVGSDIRIDASTFSDNVAARHGGALFLDRSTAIVLENSLVYANQSGMDNGSAVMVSSGGPPTGVLRGNQIADNDYYQLREEVCPKGELFLCYENNVLADSAGSNLFWSPCTPPGIHSVSEFNSLSDNAQGNRTGVPSTAHLVAIPARAPSQLLWLQPRMDEVVIDGLGTFQGHSGSETVNPDCGAGYELGEIKVTVLPPYPGELYLARLNLFGDYSEDTSREIVLEDARINSGSRMSLSSSSRIVMKPGFKVFRNGSFHAKVESSQCDG